MIKRRLLPLCLIASLLVGCAGTPKQESSNTPENNTEEVQEEVKEEEVVEEVDPWREVTVDEFVDTFGSNILDPNKTENVTYRICDGDVPLGELTFTYKGDRDVVFRVQKTDGEQDISGITYDEWDKTGDSMGIKSKRRQDENGEMLLATWYIERYGYSYSYFVTAPDLGDGDDLILLSYAMYTGQAGAPAGYTEEDDSESYWEPEGD